MPEQRFHAPDALYLSFFSPAFYKDVAFFWRGSGFAYLAALLAICVIPGVLKVRTDLDLFVEKEFSAYVKQLPEMSISKGVLTVEGPQPYYIFNEKTGEPVMIIDTTGSINSLDGAKAFVLLTKTQFVLKKSEHQTTSFSLSDLENETIKIDRRSAHDFLDSLIESFPIIFYPFALFFSFLLHALQAMLYWGFGLLLGRTLAVFPEPKAVLRVSIVSMTPSLLIGAVFLIAGVEVPFWWLIGFFIPLAYVGYSIRNVFPAAPGASQS